MSRFILSFFIVFFLNLFLSCDYSFGPYPKDIQKETPNPNPKPNPDPEPEPKPAIIPYDGLTLHHIVTDASIGIPIVAYDNNTKILIRKSNANLGYYDLKTLTETMFFISNGPHAGNALDMYVPPGLGDSFAVQEAIITSDGSTIYLVGSQADGTPYFGGGSPPTNVQALEKYDVATGTLTYLITAESQFGNQTYINPQTAGSNTVADHQWSYVSKDNPYYILSLSKDENTLYVSVMRLTDAYEDSDGYYMISQLKTATPQIRLSYYGVSFTQLTNYPYVAFSHVSADQKYLFQMLYYNNSSNLYQYTQMLVLPIQDPNAGITVANINSVNNNLLSGILGVGFAKTEKQYFYLLAKDNSKFFVQANYDIMKQTANMYQTISRNQIQVPLGFDLNQGYFFYYNFLNQVIVKNLYALDNPQAEVQVAIDVGLIPKDMIYGMILAGNYIYFHNRDTGLDNVYEMKS